MPVVLTRPPAPSFAEGCELTFVPRRPIDPERAAAQHAAYVAALEEAGCRVVRLPPLDRHPDSVFVEDVAVALPEVIVLCRPGAASRRGEVGALEREMRAIPPPPARPRPAGGALGRPLARIEAPATLDGGDVLRLGRRIFVGRSTRTDRSGIAALARIVEAHGYQVVPVDVDGALHLKTACSVLEQPGDGAAPRRRPGGGGPHAPAGDVLVDPRRVDASVFGPAATVAVHPDEPGAANAVRIPPGRGGVAGSPGCLLASASGPRTVARLRRAGYEVRTVELDELEKGEGGPTCLSLFVPPAAG